MIQLCRHIKTDGKRCQSPALSESAYCYFHSRVHTMAKTKATIWDNIYLPILEDPASIQVAIHQITSAYLCSRLDARHTGLLLYALQIASQNIDRKTFHSDSEIVRSMTVTEEGDELAPAKEKCEPSDCASCHRRDTCADYYPDEEDCDSDEDEEDCDSERDDNDAGEDDRDSDEEDEEPALPSPARPGIQRLQRAILARLPELKALRPPGEDPDCGIRQAAEKLKPEGSQGPQRRVLVAGLEEGSFDPHIKPSEPMAASAADERFVLKGHDFSRAENATKDGRALAPEGSLSPIPPENPNLSATPGEIIIPVLANGEPLYPLRSAIRTG